MLDELSTHHGIYSATCVRWICESQRPMAILKDPAFLKLMKTGRPGAWIPSLSTITRALEKTYEQAKAKIMMKLQVSETCA